MPIQTLTPFLGECSQDYSRETIPRRLFLGRLSHGRPSYGMTDIWMTTIDDLKLWITKVSGLHPGRYPSTKRENETETKDEGQVLN